MLAGLLFKGFIGTIFLVVAFLMICSKAQIINGQTPATTPEITILEPDKPIEREIAGGQKNSFQITLSENQYAELIIEQKGIDLVITIYSPDGKDLTSFNNEIRKIGNEEVFFTAPASGIYQIEIVPIYQKAQLGKYLIELNSLRVANEKDLQMAKSQVLLFKANKLNREAKFAEGIALAEEALKIREQLSGVDSLEVTDALRMLVALNIGQIKMDKAEPYTLRYIKILEKKDGEKSIKLTTALIYLGTIFLRRGNLDKAVEVFLRTRSILEENDCSETAMYGGLLNSLGNTYNRLGEIEKSLATLRKSLQIREKLYGENHLEVAQSLNNIGLRLADLGDLQQALALSLRVLAIRQKLLRPDHPEIVRAMNNVGLNYRDLGDLENAQNIFQQGLAILEKVDGEEDNKTTLMNNLAGIFGKRMEYDKAIQMFQQAMDISSKAYGAETLDEALFSYNIALMSIRKGDFTAAETPLLRSLVLREKLLGKNQIEVAQTYSLLSLVYASKKELSKSLDYQKSGREIFDKIGNFVLSDGSQREQLDYLMSMRSQQNRAISLNANFWQADETAKERAFLTVLQRKGRVLDLMANSVAVLRQRAGKQEQEILDKYQQANLVLAKFELNGEPNLSIVEAEKKLQDLRQKKESLESEINRLGGGFFVSSNLTVDSIKKLLQPNQTLIEFFIYQPENYDGRNIEERYIAYILSAREGLKWRDLGEVKTIDESIKKFREALRDPRRKDVQKIARELDEKIMSPIRQVAGDTTQLLISPDRQLNLIPFEALVDADSKYLVEKYSISYLSSGRDLLRMQNSKANQNPPLIIANPAFGEFETAQNAVKSNSQRDKRRSITVAKNLAETYFAPLSGTEQEGRAIKALFPESTLLMNEQATKNALLQTKSPKILHIATHGFFIESEPKSTENENPLLRSGLALSEANNHTNKENKGILTALESSGLNLFGTKLVVLSACDTGLGDVQTSEGVFGLRRAFVLAGTESMVMSLWSVSDYVTRELMTNYYKNLKTGMGRNAALRQVQLQMLQKSGRQHPFYWASFIQSGEWANLEGKR